MKMLGTGDVQGKAAPLPDTVRSGSAVIMGLQYTPSIIATSSIIPDKSVILYLISVTLHKHIEAMSS